MSNQIGDFHFESNKKYNKLINRIVGEMFYYFIFTIGFSVIFYLFAGPTDTVRFVLIGGAIVIIIPWGLIASFHRVRNYIIKLDAENNVLTIDYVKYNNKIHYKDHVSSFEIKKVKKIGDRYRNNYCLNIRYIADESQIKQFECLDWNEKIMDAFLYRLN